MSPNVKEIVGTAAECQPDDFAKLGFSTVCQYVRNHSELCDGGGYLRWTEYALCSSSISADVFPSFGRVLIVLCSVLSFVLLFLHLSITANSFFCKNIAAIVDLHHISQNIAGVSFMAFGNGTPDIFSSIASVISVKRPRADLAISELLGGGLFVTTFVVALIAFNRPFHLMRRPILRDIFFYLLALLLLVFVSYSSRTMQLWHPCAFLLLYIVYAAFVIVSNLLRQRLRPVERRRRLHKTISRFSLFVPPKSGARGTNRVAPIDAAGRATDQPNKVSDQQKGKGTMPTATEEAMPKRSVVIATPRPMEIGRTSPAGLSSPTSGRGTTTVGLISAVVALSPSPAALITAPSQSSTAIPRQQQNVAKSDGEQQRAEGASSANAFLEAGKFFAKEELDELSENESADLAPAASDGDKTHSVRCSSPSATPSSASISDDDRPRGDSALGEAATPIAQQWKAELRRALRILCPLNTQRLRHSSLPTRLLMVAKMPSLLLLRLTVPCAAHPWSKPIAAVHAFLAPLVFCAAFQCLTTPLPIGAPFVFGELALLLSVLLTLFILCTTKLQEEATCYKRCAAYIGFGISIAWIYATASEVMNVVLMFGTISGISHQILGLTAIAWANSIGDLIADVAVARQGMSRMAFSAAIGGPLFNLVVGFGITFLIAELQGKVIIIEPDPVALVMFVFLILSLLCTLALLLLQKFFVRRAHGFVLLALYALFLLSAILASQRALFSWPLAA